MDNWLGLPVLASEHGSQIDFIIAAIHLVMLVALVGWGVFFIIPLFKFRSGKQPRANYHGLGQQRLPYVAVGLVALAEMVLLLGFSLPFWHDHIAAAPEYDEEPLEVRVIAQQFVWNIHYPGADGVFGRTDVNLIDSAALNFIGLDSGDPAGRDDVVVQGQFHMPVDRPVIVHLSSKDVIHSFFLPEFRVKQDAIPGVSIPLHFVPTLTTAEFREMTGNEARNFEIACAQLCGNSHYRMRGMVIVETQEEFDRWYAERVEAKSTDAEWW